MKKLLRWILTVLSAAVLLSATALAASEEVAVPAEEAAVTLDTAAVSVVDSGTCGENVTWMLDDDGTLTISGIGPMYDNWADDREAAPWNQYSHHIKAAVIGEGISEINAYAFSHCTNLTEVSIPASVSKIETRAFANCGELKSIVIPDGVWTIGDSAFESCIALEIVSLPDSLESIGEWVFWGCVKLCSIAIPENVTSIGAYAFAECAALEEVTMQKGVTSIGEQAFGNCAGLTGIVLPDSVTSLGDYAFSHCTSLRSVVLSNGLESLDYTFYNCPSLTEIVIPEGVITVGRSAFEGCTGLTDVTIPESVTAIRKYAFSGCDSLSDVYYAGTEDQWQLMYDEGYNTGLYSATIHYNCGAGGPSLGGEGSEIYIPTGTTGTTTTDENRVRRTNITFWSHLAAEGKQEVPMEIPWGWELFEQEASTYDNRLAIAGLTLSSAIEKDASHLRGLLDELGFEVYQEDPEFNDFRYWEYDTIFAGSVTHAFARKTVQFDGEDCDIFVVTCRGSGNHGDWMTDLVYDGFTRATELVWEHLQAYLLEYYNASSLSELQGKNMKFFITGHSLGGAIANMLPSVMGTLAPDEDVFVYTFASPKTWSSPWSSKTNVHNIVNAEDVVPCLSAAFFDYRIGKDYFFHRESAGNRMNIAFGLLTGERYGKTLEYLMTADLGDYLSAGFFAGDWGYDFKIGLAHDTTTYMSWLLSNSDAGELWTYGIRKASVRCPVDVEVYNADGVLVGRVVNDQVDESVLLDVWFQIIGDEKYVYLPFGEDYTFVLTGNDAGTMEFAVEEMDAATGEVTESRVFSDVVLFAGKTMTGAVGADTPEKVRLFVTDGEGNAVTEVAVDGTESLLDSVNNLIRLMKQIAGLNVGLSGAGDLNSDGVVDILDVIALARRISNTPNE